MSLEEKTRARLEAIFLTYYQDLYRYAYSKVKDAHDAENIVQQVAYNFSRIYSEKYFESDKKLKHYLMSILEEKLKKYWRDIAGNAVHIQTVDTLPEHSTLTLEDKAFGNYNATGPPAHSDWDGGPAAVQYGLLLFAVRSPGQRRIRAAGLVMM